MRVLPLAASAGLGALAYRQLVGGGLTLDTGWGCRVRQLAEISVDIAAPREAVFDVVAAPYLGRTPRAWLASSRCSSAGATWCWQPITRSSPMAGSPRR